jgi:hypothetical protein
MAEAVIVQIAEAVKDSLAGATLSQTFTPLRLYVPTYDLTQIADLKVSVMALADQMEVKSRDRHQEDHQVQVGVQKRVDATSVAAVDDLMQLVQEMADHLKDAGPMAGATWMESSNEPKYNPVHLTEHGVFTSVITATYRIIR